MTHGTFRTRLAILALALVPFVSSCDILDIAGPEAKVELVQQDEAIKTKAQELEEAKAAWSAKVEGLKDALAGGAALTPEAFEATSSAALLALTSAQAAHEERAAEWDALNIERTAIVDRIVKDAAAPLLPFLPPGVAQLSPLLLALISKRVRKHVSGTVGNTGDAVRLALEGEALKAGVSLLKAGKSIVKATTPMLHSDPEEQPQAAKSGTLKK